ncbi:MAG: hypothetical protein ACRDZ3_20755 [Acidimicrobiia bacterium]
MVDGRSWPPADTGLRILEYLEANVAGVNADGHRRLQAARAAQADEERRQAEAEESEAELRRLSQSPELKAQRLAALRAARERRLSQNGAGKEATNA